LDTSRIANGGGLEEIMNSRTNFAHRIDMWNDDGETIVEQLAGIDDCELAMAAYQFAVERWPKTAITPSAGRSRHQGQPEATNKCFPVPQAGLLSAH
jgi:hypothetical protein